MNTSVRHRPAAERRHARWRHPDELAATLLHDKIDTLRDRQWQELLAMQKQQLALLASLAGPAFTSSTGGRQPRTAPHDSP